MAIDIGVPQLGESVTEAVISRWFKAPGDAVKRDEPICELETDKINLEVNAPESGTLTEQLAEEGATVEVGALIARMEPGEVAEPEPQPEQQGTPEEKKTEDPPQTSQTAAHSPAVKKHLAETGVDANQIEGTGKDGRLTKGDVLEAAAQDPKDPPQAVSSPPEVQPQAAPVAPAKAGMEERVRMSRLRQTIARRLKEAQNTAAILTTYNEADMSAVIALRKRHQEAFEKKQGVRLGFMSFFIKAAISALKEIPAVNAEISGDEIIYKNYYNVGVAVSTDQGLVVPVIPNADQLSFAELEATLVDFGQRARSGQIGLEEMRGGTFTISNGGVFGSLMSAPILNPPQSGILGMHKIQERPVAENGEVVIRPMMYLAFSYDHRIVDGRESVTFLRHIKEAIEDPGRLLLEV